MGYIIDIIPLWRRKTPKYVSVGQDSRLGCVVLENRPWWAVGYAIHKVFNTFARLILQKTLNTHVPTVDTLCLYRTCPLLILGIAEEGPLSMPSNR